MFVNFTLINYYVKQKQSHSGRWETSGAGGGVAPGSVWQARGQALGVAPAAPLSSQHRSHMWHSHERGSEAGASLSCSS